MPLFSLPLQVRDYECDLQGIVNNAVYQHYLEHCRGEFLRQGLSIGVDDLHEQGVDTVVARLTMEFKRPLLPNDHFVVHLNLRKERIKYIFDQEIRRASDDALCLRAETTVVCRIHGKLGQWQALDALLPPTQNQQ